MIHGKSSQNYEHLGKYISALFLLDPKVPFLRVTHDKDSPVLTLRNTLGELTWWDDQLRYIEFMSGVQSNKAQKFVWFWAWTEWEDEDKYQAWADWAPFSHLKDITYKQINQTLYRVEYNYSDLSFDRILGIFTDFKNETLLMAAHSKEWPENLIIYEVGRPVSVDKYSFVDWKLLGQNEYTVYVFDFIQNIRNIFQIQYLGQRLL